MTKENIDEIRNRAADVLTPAKKQGTFVCGLCNNGTGSSGDGMVLAPNNKTTLTCFKCSFKGDVIDYYQQLYNLDFVTACKELAENLHITIDDDRANRATRTAHKPPLTAQTSNYTKKDTDPLQSRTDALELKSDFSSFYESCNKDLNKAGNKGIEYISGRGISLETCNRFNIGYCENWKPPTALQAPPSKRLIVPNSESSYLSRAIDDSTPMQYQKQKTGKQHIFNSAAIRSEADRLFIVEGEIDAMSIYEAGAEAIGTGSTSNINLLLELIDQEPTAKDKTYIVCMDNDDGGRRASEKLTAGLSERKIKYVIADITGDYKDANEHLQKDRPQFVEAVKAALQQTFQDPYASELMSNNIESLLNMFRSSDNEAIKTGFKQLDEKLNGGLHKGELTLIGAAPSLGKTTFTMQIVENIAQNTKEDILIFSLEMSKSQHMSKSLSRLTWETNSSIKDAEQDYFLLRADEITANKVPADCKQSLEKAIAQYRTYADRLHIFSDDRTIEKLTERTENFINATGKHPIIVIDYVQLLKSKNPKASTIEVVQEAIATINRLKSKYNLAIIAIVAFNRESNKDGAQTSLDSGRDTSDLEYSADTYISLNFTEWENNKKSKSDREELMKQQPRAMTAKILKQRMGEPYGKIDFIYRPHINYFEELHGNIRQIKADELTLERATRAEKLKEKIAYLKKIKGFIEAGQLGRHIAGNHRRYTLQNVGELDSYIKELETELESLQTSESEVKEETKEKTKKSTDTSKMNPTL